MQLAVAARLDEETDHALTRGETHHLGAGDVDERCNLDVEDRYDKSIGLNRRGCGDGGGRLRRVDVQRRADGEVRCVDVLRRVRQREVTGVQRPVAGVPRDRSDGRVAADRKLHGRASARVPPEDGLGLRSGRNRDGERQRCREAGVAVVAVTAVEPENPCREMVDGYFRRRQ